MTMTENTNKNGSHDSSIIFGREEDDNNNNNNNNRKTQTRAIQQWLVSFCNKTLVVDLPLKQDNEDDNNTRRLHVLLERVSFCTGWPVSRLMIVHPHQPPFVTVRVLSSIRGGKGGFGTLLRSSARQSGARLTTDFGACRDLQGRRLRHVNDEIKLRKWREAQERQKQGGGDSTTTSTDSMFDTPSGLYNWHLMVPSWADISKKSTRKIQRQFKRMQQEEDAMLKAKAEQKAQYERSVNLYVNQAAQASNQIQNNVKSALQQGLQAAKKKRKREEEDTTNNTPEAEIFQQSDRPNALCTLSGDVVVEEIATNKSTSSSSSSSCVLQIQSRSDFSTLALFLDKSPPPPPQDDNKKNKKLETILYYEVRVVTGGLAQIGWADVTSTQFKPNSEEGDGVGDDSGSFGYDGSRGLKFHASKEQVYNDKVSKWTAGDVVGCLYNLRTGEISYRLNGKDLGVAFTAIPPAPPPKQPSSSSGGTNNNNAQTTTTTTTTALLFPALSCNGGEILELHVGAKDMEFLPPSSTSNKDHRYVAVKELIATNIIDNSGGSTAAETGANGEEQGVKQHMSADAAAVKKGEEEEEEEEDSKPPAKPNAEATEESKEETPTSKSEAKVATEEKKKEPEEEKKKEPVKVEAIDLDQYQSTTELEELGLDRLKGALMAIGVKCGGSLKERAARLFSLKGLERKDYPKKVRAKNFVV